MVARTILNFLSGFLVKALNIGNLFNRHIGHFFDCGKTFRGQKLGNHLIDIKRLHKQGSALGKFGLTTLAFLRFGHNINVPAGQLRGEAHILSTPPDGEAQLLIRHHHIDALHVFIKHHFGNFRRSQRIDDERSRVGRPRNNIDLFALQLIDHGLNPTAAHANTRADRINSRIIRNHADFGPAARVARDGTHFDDAVINFRHFLHEQFRHKGRVSAR